MRSLSGDLTPVADPDAPAAPASPACGRPRRPHVSLSLGPPEHRQGEIGFLFHPDHQGRGYATEAAEAMLALAFETYELHRVVGRLEPRNVASARVLEKLGMRREAHLIENE